MLTVRKIYFFRRKLAVNVLSPPDGNKQRSVEIVNYKIMSVFQLKVQYEITNNEPNVNMQCKGVRQINYSKCCGIETTNDAIFFHDKMNAKKLQVKSKRVHYIKDSAIAMCSVDIEIKLLQKWTRKTQRVL